MPLDAYLTIAGITGSGPGGSIEIDSFSFGVENPTVVGTSPSEGSAGKSSFSDFTFTKSVDASSPKLFDTAINSMIIPTVVIKVYRPPTDSSGTGTPYLMITLSNVIIAGYKLDDGTSGVTSPCPPSAGGGPKESISMNFGQLAIQYLQQSGN